MYGNTKNMEHVMHDYISNSWSHWNVNMKLKEKSESQTRKTFNRFATKDGHRPTPNTTRYT